MASLAEYRSIASDHAIDELFYLGQRLSGRVIKNVNSTAVGGGVAEILIRLVPMMREVGLDAHWEVIRAGERFFQVTKKIHNALHGVALEFPPEDMDIFIETNRNNAKDLNLDADVVFIHDSQPVALVEKKDGQCRKWIWRCHVDFSRPDPFIWNFLKSYIERYDASVFSAPSFAQELQIPQVLISPSIDPLSEKNRELSPETVTTILERFGIDPQRPIVTQISRFDYLKDPVGVVQVFQMVRKYVDCQLVLAGGGATDDPEGEKVLGEVRQAAAYDPDIFVLMLPPASDVEINALQRASTVILQKSLREGFGLTVSEALWKSKPVIAGAVGGIPLQITHKYSGLLTHTIEGTAFALKQLLQNPDYARKLGENGREHVRRNFLITRHLRDYLLLFCSLDFSKQSVVFL